MTNEKRDLLLDLEAYRLWPQHLPYNNGCNNYCDKPVETPAILTQRANQPTRDSSTSCLTRTLEI